MRSMAEGGAAHTVTRHRMPPPSRRCAAIHLPRKRGRKVALYPRLNTA